MTSEQEIINLTNNLIYAINNHDYAKYLDLCDPNLTAFEPESAGNLVTGLEFHKFYFDNADNSQGIKYTAFQGSIINPKVHLLGDTTACIAYIRLTQAIDKLGYSSTRQCEETRVWLKKDNSGWKCVHLHRSNSRGYLESMTPNNGK